MRSHRMFMQGERRREREGEGGAREGGREREVEILRQARIHAVRYRHTCCTTAEKQVHRDTRPGDCSPQIGLSHLALELRIVVSSGTLDALLIARDNSSCPGYTLGSFCIAPMGSTLLLCCTSPPARSCIESCCCCCLWCLCGDRMRPRRRAGMFVKHARLAIPRPRRCDLG